jgi:OFA family oxalate/formate antiporter-like MFS transporter
MSVSAATGSTQAQSSTFRWVQLTIGVVCMAMIANLQYGWTYFVGPMAKAHAWDIGSIQIAFSIFVALETWLTPLQGWIVDTLGPQRGPRLMVAVGGVCVALGCLSTLGLNH